MWLKLNLEGMKLELQISNYEPSETEHWDVQWCYVDYHFTFFNCIDYSKSWDPVLLSCEIEELENNINALLSGKIKKAERMELVEPDFEFVFYPKCYIQEGENGISVMPKQEIADISMEWEVHLWDDGLTANRFITVLDRQDMIILRDYLRLVMGSLSAESMEIQELIKSGKIVL